MHISPSHPLLRRLVTLRQGELTAMLWSFAYFFCLLCSYYVLRPVRDEMGIQGGVDNLPRFRYLGGRHRGFPAENSCQSSTCFSRPTCWCSTG